MSRESATRMCRNGKRARLGSECWHGPSSHQGFGDLTRAEQAFRTRLALAETAFGADAPEAAGVLDELAVTFEYSGHSTEADRLYRRALTMEETTLGPDYPGFAPTLHNLAMVHRRRETSTKPWRCPGAPSPSPRGPSRTVLSHWPPAAVPTARRSAVSPPGRRTRRGVILFTFMETPG